MKRSFLLWLAFTLFATHVFAQVDPPVRAEHVRYYFKNTSSVNQLNYADNEIFLNVVYVMPAWIYGNIIGYFDGTTKSWRSIDDAPTSTWPDGRQGRDFNVALSDLPVDNTGKHYIDMPPSPAGGPRIYICFGGKLWRPGPGNPLTEDPGDPNYMLKIETIEFNIGNANGNTRVFTNTSRVDRYAYPIGEEIYCDNGRIYDKVGETVSHEMVILKWKRFVHDAFQYSYDATRDCINAPKGTEYFKAGNPGEHYFDAWADAFFAYYKTHTMRVTWAINNPEQHVRTATVQTINGEDVLVWSTGERFPRAAFNRILRDSEDRYWYPDGDKEVPMDFMASILRGAVRLTEELQNWRDNTRYWESDIRSDYMAFWHSDLVSFESKTYAYDLDDIFEQSSTQVCDRPDSVIVSLGGFGVEHEQILDKVYITPLPEDAQVAQYATLQMEAHAIDEHDLDMPMPDDAVITWTVTNPQGNPANNLISNTGLFGPTSVTGDYTVTLTVVSGGRTFTATRVVTVKDPMDVPQVCSDQIGDTDEQWRLEIIGKKVYFTLVTNRQGVRDFFYCKDGIHNHAGHRSVMPNVPYPIDDAVQGDELYFWIGQANGGLLNVHIPKLGTCEGLPIMEDVIALLADNHTMAETDAPYTIPVRAYSNYRTDAPDGPFALPDPQGICTEPLTFSGQGVNPTTGVFTPTTAGTYPITITYPAVKGNVTTTITITVTPAGCTNPITVDLGPDRSICEGESTIFDAGAGYATYQWAGANLTGNGRTFEASVAGTYTVTVTDGDRCTATDEIVLTVNRNPNPTVADQETCPGQEVTFTAPNGYSSYQWDGNAGTRNFTTAVGGPHTLSVTDGNNCTGTADFTLTVNDRPTLNVNDPAPACAPNTVSIVQNEAGYTFNYYESNQTTQVANPAAIAVSGTYYISKTSTASGCVSDKMPVEVSINTAPTISITAGPTCAADLTTYSLQVTVSGGTVTTTAGTVTAQGGNVWQIAGVPAGTNITVTVTDFCTQDLPVKAPDCTCPPVDVPVSGGDKSYCGGDYPTLSVTVNAGETADWYDAAAGGTLLQAGSLTYIPAQAGEFYAEARNVTTGCVSTRTLLTVTELPEVNLGNNFSVCPNEEVELTAVTRAVNVTYEWTNATGTDANATATAPAQCNQSKTVTVTIRDNNSCSREASVTITAEDNENPVIEGAPANGVEAISLGNCRYEMPNVLAGLTFTDNCTAAAQLTVAQQPAAGTALTETTEVVVTATDGCDNTAEVRINVLVPAALDEVTISGETTTCPGTDVMLEAVSRSAGNLTYTWEGADPVATTATGAVLHASADCNGEVSAKVTISNDFGCSVTSPVHTVKAQDNENPTIALMPGTAVDQAAVAAGNCEYTVPDLTSMVDLADNCSNLDYLMAHLTQTPAAGSRIERTG
ncbi:MAG: hypothetical protein J6Z12_00420, partial [Paludibacteraceae bacterium]|nr:hypothetical protein [Paludibacteraceae bacterium]